jgi:uncharacterized protein (DUF885 family)
MKKNIPVLTLAAMLALAFPHGDALAAQAAKAAVASSVAPAVTPAQNAAFQRLCNRFLAALWRQDPDAAIAAGKFLGAASLPVPDQAGREASRAFNKKWLQRFAKIDASRLPPNQRTDLAVLINYLNGANWYQDKFRQYEWDPSQYNVANSLDVILNTDYAPRRQRLQAITRRLEKVPAYYAAARASIHNPTHEHTQLAITQNRGGMQVLEDIAKAAGEEKLSMGEMRRLAHRLGAARAAMQDYVDWLSALDQQRDPVSARSFRIGKELYEGKFAADIQADVSAEQMYQRALQAKEEAHANMEKLADQLWPKYLADTPKPEGRSAKIAMMIAKLSENHVRPDQVFDTIRAQIPVLQDWIRDHNLVDLDRNKPLVVRETPPYERGVTVASIEAPGPFRPQDKTYYNVSPLDAMSTEKAESTLREYNHWVMQILSIHEGVPGHYLQLQHANKTPSVVKALFGNGATVEGWAVYGERMMLESGYGDNEPEMWLMYYKWNLRTVCNTILDYGVHVLGMSEVDAKRFLIDEAFQTQAEADGKWQRVQYTSVQLTSYFSGYSELMALREQRRRLLGDKFDLKQFHEDFLAYGSAPIKMIGQLMPQG